MVKIPFLNLGSASWSGSPLKSNRLLLVTHPTAPKNFIQICRQIFAFPANRQTDTGKNITSLAGVMKGAMRWLKQNWIWGRHVRRGWPPKSTLLPTWVNMLNWMADDQTVQHMFGDPLEKSGSLRAAFQGHSSSSKMTRIDWVPMTSYYWLGHSTSNRLVNSKHPAAVVTSSVGYAVLLLLTTSWL